MRWDPAERHTYGRRRWCGSVFHRFFFRAERKETDARAGGDSYTFKSPGSVLSCLLQTTFPFSFLLYRWIFWSWFNVVNDRSIRASLSGSLFGGGGGPARAMAVEARPELVGKRFFCVGGDEPPEIGDVGRWPWRSGVIRAVNHRDNDNLDLTVSKTTTLSSRGCCYMGSERGNQCGWLVARQRGDVVGFPGEYD